MTSVASVCTNGVTFSTREFARIIRAPETTVAEWRRRGVGPAYQTLPQRPGLGSKVFYRLSDLLAYTGNRWPDSGRFLKTEQAAKLLGITPAALRQKRHRGGGPEPVYFESLVRYLPEECEVNHGN